MSRPLMLMLTALMSFGAQAATPDYIVRDVPNGVASFSIANDYYYWTENKHMTIGAVMRAPTDGGPRRLFAAVEGSVYSDGVVVDAGWVYWSSKASDNGPGSGIYRAREADGSDLQQVFQGYCRVFLLDGDRILCLAQRFSGVTPGLYEVGRDGIGPKALFASEKIANVTGLVRDAAAGVIYFVNGGIVMRDPTDKRGEIYRYDEATGETREIAQRLHDATGLVLVDGALYWTDRSGGDLWRLPVSGPQTAPELLGQFPYWAEGIHTDGRHVYFKHSKSRKGLYEGAYIRRYDPATGALEIVFEENGDTTYLFGQTKLKMHDGHLFWGSDYSSGDIVRLALD